MSDNVRIHIGTPEDMGRRFVDAWKRAERGEAVDETHLTFHDLPALLARDAGGVVALYAEVEARFVL